MTWLHALLWLAASACVVGTVRDCRRDRRRRTPGRVRVDWRHTR